MSRKNDDNIEKFFRKAVRQSDTTFRESDWQKMEKMLDDRALINAASTSRSLKRTVIIVAGAALLAITAYVFVFDRQEPGENIIPTQSQAAAGKVTVHDERGKSPAASLLLPAQPTEEEQPTTSAPVKPVTEPQQNEKRESLQAVNSAKSKIQTPETKVQSPNFKLQKSKTQTRSAPDRNVVNSTGRINDQQSSDLESNLEPVKTNSPTTQPASAANPEKQSVSSSADGLFPHENEKVTTGNEDEAVNTETPGEIKTSGNENPVQTTVMAPVGKDSVSKETLLAKETLSGEISEEKKKEDQQRIFPSRLNVALVAAPDFSSTNFGEVTSPGGAFGVLLGYRIFGRVTISSGVLKSSKKYEGYGKDYQPPPGYWEHRTNGVVPDRINGRCSIIEVPVLIQYDIRQSSKSRIYLSGGVSSYRMLSESYEYSFDEPNADADTGWSSSKPSSYAFGIGHLSAAYERNIAHGLSIGLEPYLKIPFKGIGWSKVNLFTTGVYLNIRYSF